MTKSVSNIAASFSPASWGKCCRYKHDLKCIKNLPRCRGRLREWWQSVSCSIPLDLAQSLLLGQKFARTDRIHALPRFPYPALYPGVSASQVTHELRGKKAEAIVDRSYLYIRRKCDESNVGLVMRPRDVGFSVDLTMNPVFLHVLFYLILKATQYR